MSLAFLFQLNSVAKIMPSVPKILAKMRRSSDGVAYSEFCKVCDHYFGEYRQSGSHRIYDLKTGNNPPINIQARKDGKAKSYQIRQVLKVIDSIEG